MISYKNPKRWTASFGTTLSPPLMRQEVQSVVIHEDYAAHKHDDDIAVVKLSTPVVFSDEVHRVCLPDATFEALPKSKVFVTGWGALKANGEYLSKNVQVKKENSSSTGMRACMLSRFNHVQLFVTLCTLACQAPLSMGFSRQEY